MATFDRVADEPDVADFANGSLRGTARSRKQIATYAVVPYKGAFRLREEGHDGARSQASAAVKLGKLVRRYDPDAGDQEGKPVEFGTVAEMEAYAKRWL